MTGMFDYRIIPAPRQSKRVKGVKSAPELFALTLTDVINEAALEGWEYLRAESLTVEQPAGWFRKPVETEHSVLVFRRLRQAAAEPQFTIPRREARPSFEAEPDEPRPEPRPVAPVALKTDRAAGAGPGIPENTVALRAEPHLYEDALAGADPGAPGQRLGPATK